MKKVFYGEKQKFLCDMLTESFKREGLEVYTTSSLEETDYFIRDFDPELLLIDILVLWPCREDFLLEIKQREEQGKRIPLVLTGFPEDQDLLSNLGVEYLAFIEKPLNPIELISQLKSLLESH